MWGADFTLSSNASVTVDGVTITFAKADGSTAPTWYTAGLRLYAKNTITVTSENEITNIVFNWEKQGSKTFASVTSKVGSYSHPSSAGKGTWTGSSKSVTFTLGSTSGCQLQLNTLSVTTASGSVTPEPDPDPTPDPEEPDPTPGTGGETLLYTWDLSKKTYSAASNTQVTWSATDVNMVADKGTAGTAPNNYLGGDANNRTSSRFYQNSILTITPEANVTITSVVFTATSDGYATALKNSAWTNATATASSKTVTVTPTNGASAISAKIGATCGFTGVTVNYTKAASDEPEPVIVKTLKSIAVTGMTTTFEQGDVFKFDGTCTATYRVTKNDVAQADETAEVTPTSVLAPDMNTIGTKEVIVSYTEGEITKTATYNITVENTLPKIVITQDEIADFTNTYAEYTWTASGVSGKIYGYKNSGMQLNSSKDGSYVYNTEPIPGYIRKIKIVKASGNNRQWTPSISETVLTSAGGTTLDQKEVAATTTWEVTGENSYFYLLESGGATVIESITIYYEAVVPQVAAPTFDPIEGTYKSVQNVTISAEDGATIHYTLDGQNPTTESPVYSTPIEIAETKTLKAIAVKDEKVSPIASAKYTINLPLTTMDQIFAKATAVGGTATPVEITFDNWVVSAVKEDGKTAFVTDGTKGFVIYEAGCGFKVGDVLSGTAACKVLLYNGFAELTGLKSTTTGLLVATGGEINVVELDADGIAALTGVNTGSLIKINGICTQSGSNYYVAGVQIYTALYDFETLKVGAEYNITGIYQQFRSTKEMLPRSAEDIEEVVGLPTATISIADITMEVGETKTIEATITPDAAQSTVQYAITAGSEFITLNGATITGVKEGTATITATIAEVAGVYNGATKTFTVTVTPKSTKDNVVVLAKYGDQWYAMMAQYVTGKNSHLAALKVDYVGGKLYNVSDENKALIEWTRAVVDGKATFYNDGKYLTGKSDKTDLTLAATACEWAIDGSSYLQGDRTFFYNAENNWFRNFKTSNAEETNYSALPVVTAPVYTTGTLYTIKATAENGTVVGAGVYVAGDKVTLTADPAMDYTFVNWTKGGEVVSAANPFVFEATENLDLVANFQAIGQTTKTLTGKFSVGEYKYAEFATGNLQYNVKNKKWSFAKQQYQYIGDANINVGDPTFTGTIDMFGWSTNETTYGVDPRNLNELYDGEFVDWGNLFPVEDNWSTLSADQWKYLLNERTNASSLKQIARVGSVVGIMLFPDNWNETPVVDAEYDSYYELYMYNYSITQWTELEDNGAVFLPAAGRRTGGYDNMINYDQQVETNPENLNGGHYKHYDNGNIYCYYWTSTINEDKNVSYLHNIQALGGDKYTIGTGAVWGEKGRYGQSVRLAKVTDIPVVIRKELTVGQLGTVCLPYNIPSGQVYGATFYTLEGKMDNKVVFDEVTDELAAGVPYLFQASAEEISCFPGTTIVTEPDNSGAMKGTFEYMELTTNLKNIYYFAKNALWSCVDLTKLIVPANCAYVDMEKVTTITGAAPVGVRRITLGVNGQQVATGVDQVQGDEVPTKMIINGQLFILRGEKMYDAQGKLVK